MNHPKMRALMIPKHTHPGESKTGYRAGLPRRIIRAHPGFTIIELLIVVGIVILLLSILIVAVNAATKTSQKSRTQALMASMRQGLIRFKGDIGYFPPVLGVAYTPSTPTASPTNAELRRLFPNSVPNPSATYSSSGSFAGHMQEYFSTCTLADYLIGYGNHYEDGYGETALAHPKDWSCSANAGGLPPPCESPTLGIRHPGQDGVWNATVASGAIADRMKMNGLQGSETAPYSIDQGKVYGPYFELKDERLLAGVNYGSSGLETYFPGDTLPGTLTWETIPKAIVDYWGMPIRYYRRPYPQGALGQSYRPVGGIIVPTLSDVYVLRPWEIKSGAEVLVDPTLADGAGSRTTTAELNSAEFALFSTGPDRQLDQTIAVDFDDTRDGDGDERIQENKDNIVEIGP